jgi:uncharacterized Fe-S cluster-containing radical SAM superfamily enzyme
MREYGGRKNEELELEMKEETDKIEIVLDGVLEGEFLC